MALMPTISGMAMAQARMIPAAADDRIVPVVEFHNAAIRLRAMSHRRGLEVDAQMQPVGGREVNARRLKDFI